jgi:hypothetical protein
MIDSDSDEDIKRAIALSLQQPSPTASQKTEVIDLISDDEDDDLGAPLVARGFTSPSKPGPDANNKGSEVSSAHTVNDNGNGALSSQMGSNRTEQNIPIRQDPPAANGILGMMNRKQMEEERRARANKKALELEGSGEQNESRKRKAPISPPATHNREGRQVMAKFSQEPDASSTQSIPTATSPSQRKNDVSEVLSLNGKVGQLASGVQYPDGVIKKTWVRGCPRQGDDIKIEEVLQKDDLELAVLSSFQVDPQWVINKLDDKTKIIWVLQAKDESEVSENFYSMLASIRSISLAITLSISPALQVAKIQNCPIILSYLRAGADLTHVHSIFDLQMGNIEKAPSIRIRVIRWRRVSN